MYTVYIGNKNYSTWSLRAWVLMKALSIPFAEKRIPLYRPDSPPHLREVSPSGMQESGLRSRPRERGRARPPPKCTRGSRGCETRWE